MTAAFKVSTVPAAAAVVEPAWSAMFGFASVSVAELSKVPPLATVTLPVPSEFALLMLTKPPFTVVPPE